MTTSPTKAKIRAGSLIAGKYRLLRSLDRGAVGVVWAAVNEATSRKVALKLIHRTEPELRERLLREARAAGALSHPNVVEVLDIAQTEEGDPVLVMELLQGETLKNLIEARGAVGALEAAAIARDVARALAAAHGRGIVHRDLKPANIFLHNAGGPTPIVKVVDFGVSKNIVNAERTLTEVGAAIGSPSYMSPEQVRADDVDGRSDLWALGIILFEMLSGTRPFQGRTHDVLAQVLTQDIPPIDTLVPKIDAALVKVVTGLLQRERDERLGPAEAVAAALEAIVDPKPKATVPRAPVRPPTKGVPAKRRADSGEHTATKTVADAVPKAYVEEDEEEEATHVAPLDLQRVLAAKTVPKVFTDDESEDGERDEPTRIAPRDEMAAAVATMTPTRRPPKPFPKMQGSETPTKPPPPPSPGDMGSEGAEERDEVEEDEEPTRVAPLEVRAFAVGAKGSENAGVSVTTIDEGDDDGNEGSDGNDADDNEPTRAAQRKALAPAAASAASAAGPLAPVAPAPSPERASAPNAAVAALQMDVASPDASAPEARPSYFNRPTVPAPIPAKGLRDNPLQMLLLVVGILLIVVPIAYLVITSLRSR